MCEGPIPAPGHARFGVENIPPHKHFSPLEMFLNMKSQDSRHSFNRAALS
jgi:hypothetical protein